jgi:hypothetical protein
MGSSRFRVATIEVSLQEKYSGDLFFRLAGPVNSGRPPQALVTWLAIEPAAPYNRKHGGGLRAWVYYQTIRL